MVVCGMVTSEFCEEFRPGSEDIYRLIVDISEEGI